MESKRNNFKILMFPWLAHGHIFPYLELAKTLLKTHTFHILFCSTPINFTSIHNFINDNSLSNSIQFVELPMQPLPELPPHLHTTKNLPRNLLFTLIKALQTTNTSFSDMVTVLKPDLLIYDAFQPWSAKIAALHGVPAVHFATIGAAALSVVHGRQAPINGGIFPFPELELKDYEVGSIDALSEFLYANIFDVDRDFFFGNFKQSCDIVLIKTSEVLEGKFLDYISALSKKNLVPVGSLVNDDNSSCLGEGKEIMQWLSKKELKSTVYVSFGSEYFLSREEIKEVAKGLDICDANFIWIIRFPVGDKEISLEEALPQGYLERVKDRGIVVTEWAPQAKILAHPNTAGFVSHCGWSSLMESLFFGVPVVAMPMQFDQPINARLAVEAGFSVEVLRDGNGVMSGEEVARGVNKVLEEKTGKRLRRRAKEMSEKMRRDEEEGMKDVADRLLEVIKNYKKLLT